MSIFQIVGGYTLGHADIVRRAMCKKRHSVLEAERENFIGGACERGVDRVCAERLFDDMSSFANYAFNKSHAAAYAILSYRTAYLKAHYPREYLAALLTSVIGNMPKIAQYIKDCEQLGIQVLPPDINKSGVGFSAEDGSIRFGLLAIKGIGEKFAEEIVKKQGDFQSLEDFIERAQGLNKPMVEALIKSGALDRLGKRRSQMLAIYEDLINSEMTKKGTNISGQLDFFSTVEGLKSCVEYPDIDELPTGIRIEQEREVMGFSFTESPIKKSREGLKIKGSRAKTLYLRVPDLECERTAKARNIIEIFEGATPVVFYDSSAKKYLQSGLSVDASDYVLQQIRTLLGSENVVIK